MSSSVGMMTFPIYGKSKIHVPNYQPDEDWMGDIAMLYNLPEGNLQDHRFYPQKLALSCTNICIQPATAFSCLLKLG